MALTQLPIGNGFYKSDSLPISAQECVNLYPSSPDRPGLTERQYFGTPGTVQVATNGPLGSDATRGAHRMNDKAYFVSGSDLCRLNSDETLDVLGTISGTGRVSMADNGTQLFILVPGGNGYIFTEPSTLTQITDPDFTANGNPQYVVFVDGYFVCTTDAKKFIVSALNDGLAWDALDFGSAESNPDGTVAPFVYKNQLFIGGERTIEAFSNIGGAGFPFQRTGLFLDEGVIAPFSLVGAADTFMFVGAGDNEGPAIWALAGNTTERVSTQAIDAILERLNNTQLESIFAWSYSQAGHYFVGFTLPEQCFVFDTTTGEWHERKSLVEPPTGPDELKRYRVNALVQAYGNLYVGDSEDGRIGRLDLDVYTEYTKTISRSFATQPFLFNMKPFAVPWIELVMESGVGNVDSPNPMVRMDRSRDGGKTWDPERMRPIGQQGMYDRRQVWRRLGRVERFDVYRFKCSEQVRVVFIGLWADVRGVA